jgi:hypothetical protein
MGQSYRIRTELGINKSINVELNQDFEFLEILSLKIQQADVYTRSCADYGVVVGRVTANNGLGIPNAKVSVFIPVEEEDLLDDTINTIYPYRTIDEKNEDGYRYNLLPYEKSYSKHAATGTFPSSRDVLTNSVASKIYEKYFRFTVKTNESGDYMIFGVPLGFQRLVMDVDLSDIGEFSLTPQDLIRIGRATENQVSGNEFRTSTDLNSLPQIVRLTKIVEISPLWGEPQICQIAINRVDFDLREDANIDIQPTAIFMGSIFSNIDKYRIRRNCRPRDNTGELCSLQSGPGQILSLRQTIRQDGDGNPILEQYQLEQSGNIIDEDGTWLTELPMNLDYVTTNEFGEQVISYDPQVGVPTKSKYRFKIKWQQSKDLTLQTRRASFLVPNVREYGWMNNADPYLTAPKTSDDYKRLKSSYYFGLDWSGYTNGFGTLTNNKSDIVVNCEDSFYQMDYNKVYTVSGLIDQYKKGNRARFIGIKEIDDDDCADIINKFPANEGYRNYDTIYFIVSLFITFFQYIGQYLLILAHVIIGTIYQIIRLLSFNSISGGIPLRLPMITYPECENCECKGETVTTTLIDSSGKGLLTPVSTPSKYYQKFTEYLYALNYQPEEDIPIIADLYSQAMGGNISSGVDTVYKVPKSDVIREVSEDNDRMFVWGMDLPLGERINIFNQRSTYFTGDNIIKVSFDNPNNLNSFHYDNTLTVLSTIEYTSGQLLTSVNPTTTSDVNVRFSEIVSGQTLFGVSGVSVTEPQQITVTYADTLNQTLGRSTSYSLSTGTTIDRQIFPIDREYFQVVTAITVADYFKMVTSSTVTGIGQSFPDILNSQSVLRLMEQGVSQYRERNLGINNLLIARFFEEFDSQYVLILQRGVDPYSPLLSNKYNLGVLFGSNYNNPSFDLTIQSRINVPIQPKQNGQTIDRLTTQSGNFYQSKFFTVGNQYSAFTSSSVGYYGAIDATYVSSVDNLVNRIFNGLSGIVGRGDFYSTVQSSKKYDDSEDLTGNSFLNGRIRNNTWASALLTTAISVVIATVALSLTAISPAASIAFYVLFNAPGLAIGAFAVSLVGRLSYDDLRYQYNSPNLYPTLRANPMLFSNKSLNVMRTDRLPSSDGLDGLSWEANNVALLQQNINFNFYEVSNPLESFIPQGFSTGAEEIGQDIDDQIYSGTVISSFSCAGMVSLDCYTGFSNNFGVSTQCAEQDQVVNGCYVLFTRPLVGLRRDLQYFTEWGTRYKFFYAMCRGVLSQTFTNNWVNGTLFAFPIQVDTTFNSQNRPNDPVFCKDIVFFDDDTNNFYYRSSPWSGVTEGKFIGKLSTGEETAVNAKNLLFPTTIIDLGYKDGFYSEITLKPDTNAYIMESLNPTSYSDPSDIINLFVISRILNSTFLRGDSLNNLFSRNASGNRGNAKRRVDGDLAQMLSINSEEGVIKFSPEYYESTPTNSPVGIFGNANNPVIGIFYSSTTENLQFKDFITPGKIDFRPSPTSNYTPYTYGIKSQLVPFYPWRLDNTSQIFGTELNNWDTTQAGIVQYYYQSLDRINPQHYFFAQGLQNDISKRGYIFNVSDDTISQYSQNYKPQGPVYSNRFIVGAPFHFYFGTTVGASALDKFKTKYSVDE